MSRFCTFFSSSKGNCAYLSGGGASLLIDAGASCKAIMGALSSIGQQAEKLAGIFITHEHTDHIRGLRVLLHRVCIPVYASARTLDALIHGGHIPPNSTLVELAGEVDAGGIGVRAFDTPHDAVSPVGLRFSLPDGRKAGVATDLGRAGERMEQELSGCDLILLESNYDPDMLWSGPYPHRLKKRITSGLGHLSNADSACLSSALLKSGTTRFVLGHLSVNNNLPEIAYQSSRAALEGTGAQEGRDYLLSVAPAYHSHPMIIF